MKRSINHLFLFVFLSLSWMHGAQAEACTGLASITQQEETIRAMALKGSLSPLKREELLQKNKDARISVIMTCVATHMEKGEEFSSAITAEDLRLVLTRLNEESESRLREYDREILKAKKSRLTEFARQLATWKQDYKNESQQSMAQYERLIAEHAAPASPKN